MRALAFLLAGALLAAALLPVAADAQSLSDRLVAQLGLKAPQHVAGLSAANLPGFKRHGTSLIGIVRTEDGTAMRLVFDARTLTLIGAKRVEAPPLPQGCISRSPVAPLPGAETPAN